MARRRGRLASASPDSSFREGKHNVATLRPHPPARRAISPGHSGPFPPERAITPESAPGRSWVGGEGKHLHLHPAGSARR